MENMISDPQLQKIIDNPSNKLCFECDQEDPQWISINNGIFICLSCCNQHKELGSEYSQIKSFLLDNLTETEISYLQTGGNNKLRNFFEGFNISRQTFSIENKYKTKASVYYRALLKNLVEGGELPDPPSLNEGSLLENESFPKQEANKSWGFGYFQTAKNLFGVAIEKTSQGLSKVNEKIKDSHLKDNIVNIGNQVISKSKEIGSDVYEKSKVVGTEVYSISKELGQEAYTKSKEYGKIISDKSIAFGNQVAEKSKVLGQEVIEKTKKGYDHISKGIHSGDKKEKETINFEEMSDLTNINSKSDHNEKNE